MIVAFDVHYEGAHACVGAVLFDDWTEIEPTRSFVIDMPVPDEYEPGQFYRRELPCLLAAWDQIAEPVRTIVVDGYVWLAKGRPGLGQHLYEALDGTVAVVGVAKNPFADNDAAQGVLRGNSRQPLYVTSSGLEPGIAAEAVSSMHGPHRMPTLLKLADQLARGRA